MNFVFKSIMTLIFVYSSNAFSSEKMFNVVINEPSSDQRAIAFVDTVTGKDRIIEVNMNGEVIWEWKFPYKLANETDNLCNGADIKYVQSTDEFIFILPFQGAYLLGRDGDYKQIIKDNFISHDIDILPNGNFIYARGFVNKGEDEVREISPSGDIVWRWSHSNYFPNRDEYLKDFSKRKIQFWKKRTLKTDDNDWAHLNGVERFKNGDTLVSLRNFQMFVIIAPNGKPKKIFKNIELIHEPHKTDFGFIAADRKVKKGWRRHSIVIIENNGERKRLLEGQFITVRGIEQMSSNRFNITSVGNVFEINKSGKIFHRMHLRIVKEDAERNLHGKDLKKMQEKKLLKGRCGSKVGNLYKVVKTK